MSMGYKNRKKAIKKLRREYQTEKPDLLKFYAVEHNDRWCGLAARLAMRDRRISFD